MEALAIKFIWSEETISRVAKNATFSLKNLVVNLKVANAQSVPAMAEGRRERQTLLFQKF